MPEQQPELLRITAVERQPKKKDRYNIFVNDEYAFSVHADIMIKFRLMKDTEIEAAEIERIVHAEERHHAYLQSLRYLQFRPRSTKELHRKLKDKGYAGPIIESVIQQLTKERYVDDELFAKQLSEQRIFSQKKGRMWVRRELAQKGVAGEHIEEAMSGIDEETEYDSAYSLGLKKWNGMKSPALDRKQKLSAFLLRRGFPQGIVRRALRQIEADGEPCERQEDGYEDFIEED